MATITGDYRDLQAKLHENPNYGVASLVFSPLVASVILSTGVSSLSDYGAGKCNLLKGLAEQGIELADYYPYDPAFPSYGEPRTADLVCCIDVLEHVEPECLNSVLEELGSITTNLAFISIHCGPAYKVLEDGRNAHLIQAPSSWWLPRLTRHFELLHLETHELMGDGFWMLVAPRKTMAVFEGTTVEIQPSGFPEHQS